MADCVNNTVDSNLTGLSYAEEVCLKRLPTTAEDGFLPVWQNLEPNGYTDFGGELTTTARSPIDPSRQNKKGTVVDLEAAGGFNIDYTKSNLTHISQGFFFADARQNPTTKPFNGAQATITSVAIDAYNVSALGAGFVDGTLLLASGFASPSNNGLKKSTAATAIKVTVAEVLVVDAAPAAATKLEAVGFEFDLAEVSFAVTDGIPSLTSSGINFTTLLNLFPGKWIFIGGDGSTKNFANNRGYARISSIAAARITFDDVTFAPVAEAGAGKTIQIFSGTVVKNEKSPSLIKRRSYAIERTLGEGENGTQAEYLKGAVPNEFTLNIPQAEKLNVDMGFIACDNVYVSGDPGDELEEGTRVPALGEDAYNTSSDIYRIKMHVHDPATANPTPLFGFVSEGNISISNGVTARKAVGVLGAFETSAGNFEVGGSVTAYFSTVAAVKAIRANADVGLSIIGAARNAGFVYDIPLMSLGGGRLAVEKDEPIMVPLEPAGAENKYGYTLLSEVFSYLPNLAMPD